MSFQNHIRPFLPKTWLRALCGGLLMAGALAAHAQAFPVKPIRLVVGFGAGGLGDIVARALGQKMSESMGQSVVVENMPGAGGITASAAVARAAPDGYTLLLVSGQNAISGSLFKSLPYHPVNSYAMISTLGTFHYLVVVDKDSPHKTLAEVLAAAQKDPAQFNIATVSVGSVQNLSARLMVSTSGLKVPVVPFKSTTDIVSALKGQTVQAAVETTPGVLGQVKSGNLRAIATTAPKRASMLPAVPTFAESGVASLKNFEADSWNGIVAPAGTPRDVVMRLNSEIVKALADPALRQKMVDLGIEPGASTPEQLKQVFLNDAAKWDTVIRQANIEKQ